MANNQDRKTDEYLERVVALEQERMKKLSDIAEKTKLFFVDQPEYDKELLIWKQLSKEDVKRNLTVVLSQLENVADWKQDNLDKTIVKYLVDHGYKLGDYLWPMRVALTGEKNSPGPFEVAAVLGKELSLQRIKHSIESML